MRWRALTCMAAAWVLSATTAVADPVWHPAGVGSTMTEYVHNTGSGRSIIWAEHAGFEMAVDGAATYDNWTGVDEAPQVRISTGHGTLGIRDTNFVITAKIELTPGYGTRFHAGICVVFGNDDVLVWGPHGSTDLRLRRPGSSSVTQTYTRDVVWLKLKREANIYWAWYSEDGEFWHRAGHIVTLATDDPLYIGTILKTWNTPHAETVKFHHLEVTHVENDHLLYAHNTRYGTNDATAMRMVYGLSGIEILFRLYVHDIGPAGGNPYDTKLYLIHGAGKHDTDGDGVDDTHDAHLTFDRITGDVSDPSNTQSFTDRNAVFVAPRFLHGTHPYNPYDDRARFYYQNLRAEEDRILMDLHENVIRYRFPAGSMNTDERFYILGHSGGGQFVARFIMAHGDKPYRAVASSPATTSFPMYEYEWPRGISMPQEYLDNNPELIVDLPSAYALPLAVVVGENDNIVGRGSEADHYEDWALTHSRHDEARKWVRQMYQLSGHTANTVLYLVPEGAHGFSSGKRHTALTFLFGNDSEMDQIRQWKYEFTNDHQDAELFVTAADVAPELLYYHEFTRFGRPPYTSEERYEFSHGSIWCDVTDHNGVFQRSTTYSLTHDATTLSISVDGEDYTYPSFVYGKLRLYSESGDSMLEQSPVVTYDFIDQQIIDRTLNIYTCTGRDEHGPTADPLPDRSILFNWTGTATVFDLATGMPVSEPNLEKWHYDNAMHLLYFTNASETVYHDIRIGEWRWGTDALGQPFLAGWQTKDESGIPRVELQTGDVYNPRYFEEWDVATLDFDGDGHTDIVDNCPTTANATQDDYDDDRLGNECDSVPLHPPANVAASDGAFVGYLWVSWDAVPHASHYRVFRAAPGNPGGWLAISPWQVTRSFLDVPPLPGREYYYRAIAAVDAVGTWQGAWSATDAGWAALAPPENVSATDATETAHVGVSWNSSIGATHYRVYRNTNSSPAGALPISAWTAATSFEDGDAVPGLEYCYFVSAAVNAVGTRESRLSTPECGTRAMDCNANDMPDSLDIESGGSGDCDSNDVPDECDIDVGTHDDCNLNEVPDQCDLLPFNVGFGVGLPYSVPDGPYLIRLASMNTDSLIDLVICNYFSQDLWVMLGHRTGGFVLDDVYPLGNSPCALAVGDFDGDRATDLAVATCEDSKVRILANSGDGTLTKGPTYDVPAGPMDMVTADMDNDNDLDLLMVCYLDEMVHILENTGRLAFEEMFSKRVGNEPVAIVAAHLDRDQHLDFAVANYGDDDLTLVRGLGDGAFAGAGDFSAGPGPRAIQAVDVDGDRLNDLAVVNVDDAKVTVLYNGGDWTFPRLRSFGVGTLPQDILACDADADGDPDLVTADRDSDTVTLLLNNGAGAFADGLDFPAGNGPVSLDAADLDRDAIPDLVAANVYGDSVSILPNVIILPVSDDCTGNDTPDECDIGTGLENDCNNSDVPDACETIADCDFNVDGTVDLTDYAAFFDSAAGPEVPPNPSDEQCAAAALAAFDADGDSDVDLKDFGMLNRLFDGP